MKKYPFPVHQFQKYMYDQALKAYFEDPRQGDHEQEYILPHNLPIKAKSKKLSGKRYYYKSSPLSPFKHSGINNGINEFKSKINQYKDQSVHNHSGLKHGKVQPHDGFHNNRTDAWNGKNNLNNKCTCNINGENA